jgi:hypothetical protein
MINKKFTIYMATFYWPFSGNFIKSEALWISIEGSSV